MTSEIEKNGLGKFTPINSITVAEILVGHGRFVNVQHLLPVVRSSFEGICTIRQKVVQRGKHFCINDVECAFFSRRCTTRRSPSKKSTASDLKSPYVNSNTGHMFGEMEASLNVRLSTNSYMLSNKSKDRVSARQKEHSPSSSAHRSTCSPA